MSLKLSTKGRYGLKAMLDLALNSPEGAVTIKSIAERQSLSENYLEQLFLSLRKANLIKSIRGAQGGYIITKDPKEITVGDILRALEGSLSPVECIDKEGSDKCNRSDYCVSQVIWKKIRDGINQVVDSISLNDMMNEYSILPDCNIIEHTKCK